MIIKRDNINEQKLRKISVYPSYSLYYDIDRDSICFFDGQCYFEICVDDVFESIKDDEKGHSLSIDKHN